MLSGLATGLYVACGHKVALDNRMLLSNASIKPIMLFRNNSKYELLALILPCPFFLGTSEEFNP